MNTRPLPWPVKCPTCGRRWRTAGWDHAHGGKWYAVCIVNHRFSGVQE